MFTCVTVANRESLTECAKYSFRGARAGFVLIACGIATVVAVLGIDSSWGTGMTNTVLMSLLAIAGIALSAYICFTSYKVAFSRFVARMAAQVRQAYGTASVELPTRFDRDLMEVVREDGAVATLSMTDLQGWHETEHYITLSFGSNLLLPLDKFRIEGGSLDEFRAYIDRFVR